MKTYTHRRKYYMRMYIFLNLFLLSSESLLNCEHVGQKDNAQIAEISSHNTAVCYKIFQIEHEFAILREYAIFL